MANQTKGSSRAGSLSSFFVFQFLAGSGDRSPYAWSLTFSLHVVAGRIVELSESCVDDIGDAGVAELEEPIDKLGTAGGTENYV